MQEIKKGRWRLTMLAPVALLALGACATPFRADVSRFQALPATQGQSFAVVAADPALAGGLEFEQYARLVEGRMKQLGYTLSNDPAGAQLLVSMDYEVDKGQEKVVQDYDPIYPGGFYGPRFRGYYGNAYRWGYYDPFVFGGSAFSGYGGVRSYTVYTSELDLKIDRQADNQRLFEGTAEARSRSNNLTYLVPNLVEAMFTDFPGNSGETVKISVAPEKK